jgi:hypothetical protein
VKYLVTATASSKPDTARIIKWASLAARKFPGNTTLLKQAVGAYSQVGASDSLLPALEKLVKVDSAAAVGFALTEAKNRQDAKQFKESDPFIAFAAAHGDVQAKEGAAGFMLQGILPMLQQQPPNWAAAADSLRAVTKLVSPTGRVAPIADYFLGLSLVNLIVVKDKAAEQQKSCDLAREVEALEAEAGTVLAGAEPYIKGAGAGQADTYTKLLGYVNSNKARTASMIKVYCK